MSQLREPASAPEDGLDLPSGRLLVRMPRTLHAELTRTAEREGVSLNQLIIGTLASSIGWRDGGEQRAAPAARSRLLPLVLAANFAVVAVTAAIAIALLIVAWRGA